MPTVLELRRVSKQFSTHRAVDNLSFQLEQGECFSLLGPSGCGKTTTLRMIAGFESPTEGKILLNGQTIEALKPYQRNVSTVFQNYALFPHLTVRGNIEFGLRRSRTSDIAAKLRDVLELVQLKGKEDRLPSQISGGEKQRVALARSLVLAPEVLLLDEPLSALDPNLRKQLRSELKSLQRRVGITFLFVTHDKEEALSLSDRIGVMEAGVLRQVGTPEDLYLRPGTRFVAQFLGELNWFNPIGVRPEAVRISAALPVNGACVRAGVVTGSSFLGNCVRVEGRLDDGSPVLAETSRVNDGRFSEGDRVHFWWHTTEELRFE